MQKISSICVRVFKDQYMVLVGIYNIIEELSYFFYFLQNKTFKYFPVKNNFFDHTISPDRSADVVKIGVVLLFQQPRSNDSISNAVLDALNSIRLIF